MIIEALTVASTLLWLVLCYLCYRSGHHSGFLAGVAREKDTRPILLASAKAAGRLEAWREIDDMIERMTGIEVSDDQRVH